MIKSRVPHIKDDRGFVLSFTVAMLLILIAMGIFLSNLVQRDARLLRKASDIEAARRVAEAGVNHALARVKKNGFHTRSDFSGSLDTGSYSVVYAASGGRHLIVSSGTTEGATATVSAEVEDTTPTALYYFAGAGNDLKVRASGGTHSIVIGDLHANNEMWLRSAPNSDMEIEGDVSATGIIQEGAKHYDPDNSDDGVFINGIANDGAYVEEYAPRITFPVYDFSYYRERAMDSGDYYATDQSFNNVALTPANGIVYVDGKVDIHGVCSVEGGIVADSFNIHGTLNQYKSGEMNVIIAKGGDVAIHGRFYAEEAIVDSMQDIASHENGATFEINGIMIARRDVSMWNVRTEMIYRHVLIIPPSMTNSSGVRVVSWNR